LVLSGKQIADLDTSIISLNGEIQALHNKDWDISLNQNLNDAFIDLFDETYDIAKLDSVKFSDWLNGNKQVLDINNDGILEAIKGINDLGERFVEMDINSDGIMDVRLVYDQAQNLIGIETNTGKTAASLYDKLWNWANANVAKPNSPNTYTKSDYQSLFDISKASYDELVSGLLGKYDKNRDGGFDTGEYKQMSAAEIARITKVVDVLDLYGTKLVKLGDSKYSEYTSFSENWNATKNTFNRRPKTRDAYRTTTPRYTTMNTGAPMYRGGNLDDVVRELRTTRKQNTELNNRLLKVQSDNNQIAKDALNYKRRA